MIFLATALLFGAECARPSDEAVRMRCAEAALAQAEKSMSFAFARALDTARINDHTSEKWEPSREARTEAAQEAWLKYRDIHCAAQFLAPVAIALENVNRIWCRTRLTNARTAELNHNFIVD